MVKSVFTWDYGKFVPSLFHPSLTKHSSDEASVPSFPVQCLLDMKIVVFVPVGFLWYPNTQEFYRHYSSWLFELPPDTLQRNHSLGRGCMHVPLLPRSLLHSTSFYLPPCFPLPLPNNNNHCTFSVLVLNLNLFLDVISWPFIWFTSFVYKSAFALFQRILDAILLLKCYHAVLLFCWTNFLMNCLFNSHISLLKYL